MHASPITAKEDKGRTVLAVNVKAKGIICVVRIANKMELVYSIYAAPVFRW